MNFDDDNMSGDEVLARSQESYEDPEPAGPVDVERLIAHAIARADGNVEAAKSKLTSDAYILTIRSAFVGYAVESYLRKLRKEPNPPVAEAGGGPYFGDTQNNAAPTRQTSTPDTGTPSKPAGGAEGKGQRGADTQTANARPSAPKSTPQPSEADRAADRAVAKSVAETRSRSILDTFRVWDGRAIGDLRWRELAVLRRKSILYVHVVDLAEKYAGGHVPAEAFVRDTIGAKKMQEIHDEAQARVAADAKAREAGNA